MPEGSASHEPSIIAKVVATIVTSLNAAHEAVLHVNGAESDLQTALRRYEEAFRGSGSGIAENAYALGESADESLTQALAELAKARTETFALVGTIAPRLRLTDSGKNRTFPQVKSYWILPSDPEV